MLGHRRKKTTGGGFQPQHVSTRERAGADRIVPQNIPQSEDPVLRNEHAAFPMCFRFVAETVRAVKHRYALNRKFKTEWCLPALGPIPHGGVTNASNNLRRLPDVIEPLAVDGVRLRRTARWCFWFRFHSRRVARRWSKVTRKFSKLLKVLPGLLVARTAGAALTGSAPAVQFKLDGDGRAGCGGHGRKRPRVTAYPLSVPIEPTTDGLAYLIADILRPEPWAAARSRELWKNDATGWSFDE
jgi:hypothetical protein